MAHEQTTGVVEIRSRVCDSITSVYLPEMSTQYASFRPGPRNNLFIALPLQQNMNSLYDEDSSIEGQADIPSYSTASGSSSSFISNSVATPSSVNNPAAAASRSINNLAGPTAGGSINIHAGPLARLNIHNASRSAGVGSMSTSRETAGSSIRNHSEASGSITVNPRSGAGCDTAQNAPATNSMMATPGGETVSSMSNSSSTVGSSMDISNDAAGSNPSVISNNTRGANEVGTANSGSTAVSTALAFYLDSSSSNNNTSGFSIPEEGNLVIPREGHLSPEEKRELLRTLKQENNRYRTFFPNWAEHNNFLSPVDLAREGFFYYNDSDKVQCVFCMGIIGHWDRRDIVRDEHSRLFPRCPFVMGLPVGNVPWTTASSARGASALANSAAASALEGGNSQPASVSPPEQPFSVGSFRESQIRDNLATGVNTSRLARASVGQDVAGTPILIGEELAGSSSRIEIRLHAIPEREQRVSPEVIERLFNLEAESDQQLENLGVLPQTAPVHPDYRLLAKRLTTFSVYRWPTGLKQKPEELAGAGFFYMGRSDLVRCYHCGLALEAWAPGEKPWVEHAKWRPDCVFLKVAKGKDFISHARKSAANQIFAEFMKTDEYKLLTREMRIDVRKVRRLVVGRYLNSAPPSIAQNSWTLDSLLSGLENINMEEPCDFDDDYELLYALAHEYGYDIPPTSGLGPDGDHLNEEHEPSEAREENKVSPATAEDSDAERARSPSEARTMCKVCLDQEIGVVFLPCGHLCACYTCAITLDACPICRKRCEAMVRTYLS